MRTLYVHFGDNWLAGSERSLLDILSHGKNYGVKASLWCNGSLMKEAAEKLGIPVYNDNFEYYFDYSSPRFSLKKYLYSVKKGIELIRSTKAEIIHCNSGAPAQWMLLAAWWTGTPVVVNIRAPYLRRSRYVLGLHLADSIIAISNAIAQPLLDDGMPPEKIAVIHNGFDPGPLLDGNQSDLRAQLGIAEEALVGAIVGSLIHRKGHDVLFKAMESLGTLDRPFHVLVVGDGPEGAAFQRLAAGLPVHFLGYRSDIGAILRDTADFLLVPSRQEAFGRVIIEAALCGIPAIGSTVNGIPEAIEEGVTGLLVPSDSPSALAEAIRRLVGNEDLRCRMGDAAKARAKLFSLDNSIKRYIGQYNASVEAHTSRKFSFSMVLRRIKPYYKAFMCKSPPPQNRMSP